MSDDQELTTEERALVLSGRIPLITKMADRLTAVWAAGDGLPPQQAELAVLRALKDVQDWLEAEGAAASAELDSLRKAIGIPSQFN